VGFPAIAGPAFLLSDPRIADVAWLALDGEVMTPADWLDASGMELRLTFAGGKILSLRFDRQDAKVSIDFEREEEIR